MLETYVLTLHHAMANRHLSRLFLEEEQKARFKLKKSRAVVINGRFLDEAPGGVQRYSRSMARALSALRDDLILAVSAKTTVPEDLSGLEVIRIGSKTGTYWENVELPLSLSKYGYPLLINLGNRGPLIYSNAIWVIHDALPARYPQSYTYSFRLINTVSMVRLRGSSRLRIATVSEFSRTELALRHRIPETRVTILSNATDASIFNAKPSEEDPTLGLVAFGNGGMTKNVGILIQCLAFDQARLLPDLTLIGPEVKELIAVAPELFTSGRIKFTGRLSDIELARHLRGALVFVYPTDYDGFGLPPLEAQACGTPVVTSDIPVMHEILRDAAVYFERGNLASLRQAIVLTLSSQHLREQLTLAGQLNVQRYSWERSADALSRLIDGH